MKKIIVRLFTGLFFAIPLMLLTFAVAQARESQQSGDTSFGSNSSGYQSPTDDNIGKCQTCHEDFYTAWSTSRHSVAFSSEGFQGPWEDAGKPDSCLNCHTTGYNAVTNTAAADNVTCEACHAAYTSKHPAENMPVDRSGKTCGDCHRESYDEWQVSAHRDAGLDCVACHDVHTTQLKAENALALCATCHAERASEFTHATHSEQNVECVDCHIEKASWTVGEGHSRVNHSFEVDIDTCLRCHDESLHQASGYVVPTATPIPPDAMSAIEDAPVSETPQPVSPIGFTALAGVVGIGFGVVLAPWIEKRIRGGK